MNKAMLATSENNEIHNLKSEPGLKPKAIPGFSINVILKKFPITGMDSPGYIPVCVKCRKGMLIPLM